MHIYLGNGFTNVYHSCESGGQSRDKRPFPCLKTLWSNFGCWNHTNGTNAFLNHCHEGVSHVYALYVYLVLTFLAFISRWALLSVYCISALILRKFTSTCLSYALFFTKSVPWCFIFAEALQNLCEVFFPSSQS